jgi:hypothetical protein
MREDFTLPLVVKIFEVIAASVVLDLIWITANRLIVRRAIARRAITGLIVFQLIVALLIWLSYDPEIWGVELYVVYDLDSVFYWLLASRLLLVAFFAVIFFVQLAAIATRILTPIIGRLMYSAQRFQIIQHRRLTGGIGFGLLGLSLSDPAWLSFVAHLSA